MIWRLEHGTVAGREAESQMYECRTLDGPGPRPADCSSQWTRSRLKWRYAQGVVNSPGRCPPELALQVDCRHERNSHCVHSSTEVPFTLSRFSRVSRLL